MGESILGYCWRLAIADGQKRIKGLADYLVDRRTLQPPWIVPTNLRQLYERLHPVFESPDQIVRGHTCLPAFMPFVHNKRIPALLNHLLDGVHIRGVASLVGLASRNIESRSAMALCLKCVKCDQERLGFAFWHREHQLPGLGYCPQHGGPLVAGCGACQFSHPNNRKPRLPKMKCWCGQPHNLSHPPVSDEDGVILTRMARMAVRLFRGALAGATPEKIGAYYHLQAQRAGYARKSYIAAEEMVRAVQDTYSKAVLSRLNASLGMGRNWMEVNVGQRRAPLILGRNLMLMDFFGRRIPNQVDLRQAVKHECSLETLRDSLRKPRAEDGLDEGKREEIRETLLGFKQDNPGEGRTELIREFGGLAIWARDNDAAWYDEKFPSQKRGKKVETPEVRAARWRAFDERTSSYIFSHQLRLLSERGQPKMVSKSLLLRGTPRGNEVSWERLKLMPLTKQALNLCVETPAEYKIRYARWLLDELPNTEDLWYEVRDRTGLSLTAIARLSYRQGRRRSA